MWRLLDIGEEIKAGDEVFDCHGGLWEPLKEEGFGIGLLVHVGDDPIRRKISDAAELGTSHNTGSPKLPKWEDVEKECGPYHVNGDRWHIGYSEGVKRCFQVIVRQLRAGA